MIPIPGVGGGAGGGLSQQSSATSGSKGEQAFEGSFGAAWTVATSGSKAAASDGLNLQTLLIIGAVGLVGFVILKRRG